MNRSELIRLLRSSDNPNEQGVELSAYVCGNTLWALWHDKETYIVVYILKGKNREWSYIRQTETTPPSDVNCPLNYLVRSKPLNLEWRKQVFDFHDRIKRNNETIKSLYESCNPDEIVVAEITARPGFYFHMSSRKVKSFEVEIVKMPWAFRGRAFLNGLLYKIPIGQVTQITKQKRRD